MKDCVIYSVYVDCLIYSVYAQEVLQCCMKLLLCYDVLTDRSGFTSKQTHENFYGCWFHGYLATLSSGQIWSVVTDCGLLITQHLQRLLSYHSEDKLTCYWTLPDHAEMICNSLNMYFISYIQDCIFLNKPWILHLISFFNTETA